MKKILTIGIFILMTVIVSNSLVISAQSISTTNETITTGSTYDDVFPDDNLSACVATKTGHVPTDVVTQAELDGIADLSCVGASIQSIEGVQYLNNITYISFANNQITDLSPLSGLTKIESLYINDNPFTDVSPLSSLTTLTTLSINFTEVTDISPLSSLVNMKNLYIASCYISDITPLAGMNLTVFQGYSEDVYITYPTSGTLVNPISSTSILGTTGDVSYSFNGSETYDPTTGTIILDPTQNEFYFEDGAYNGTIHLTYPPFIYQPGDTTINEGDTIDLMSGVSANDFEDGDLTSSIMIDNVDGFKGDGTDAPGTYTIIYTVTDSEGHITSVERTITVLANAIEPTIPENPTDNSVPTQTTTTDQVTSEPTISETGITSLIVILTGFISTVALYTGLRFKIK